MGQRHGPRRGTPVRRARPSHGQNFHRVLPPVDCFACSSARKPEKLVEEATRALSCPRKNHQHARGNTPPPACFHHGRLRGAWGTLRNSWVGPRTGKVYFLESPTPARLQVEAHPSPKRSAASNLVRETAPISPAGGELTRAAPETARAHSFELRHHQRRTPATNPDPPASGHPWEKIQWGRGRPGGAHRYPVWKQGATTHLPEVRFE